MSCCSPRPLSRTELRHYSSYLLKTSVLVLIIMFIVLKSCVLNHISLTSDGFLSAHIRSVCHSMRVLNEVLIHTQVYVKNTRVTKTVSYVCEGKQLGNKWCDYFRSVWQQYTVNKSVNALLCCLLWGWDSKQCSVLVCADKDRTVSMFCSIFHHGIRTATPLSLEMYRLRAVIL